MSKYYKAEDVVALILNLAEGIGDLPTIEVSEEDELKFYYVESIDDYWIGQRLDNFYYAEWSDRLGFVWTHSRYLPWGEHVVAPDTLWKEHTYPSEPREIPFTEWIVGFMKKYGSKVSEDCIYTYCSRCGMRMVVDAPSVAPTQTNTNQCVESVGRAEGKWIRENGRVWSECSICGSGSSFETKYCGSCGARMKEEDK